jgi:hypothetical protein
MQQSVPLRYTPAATLHGRPHGGGRTWRSLSVLSQSSAATLPAVIPANSYGMTRCCAQNERVVFTNKLSFTIKLTFHSLMLMNHTDSSDDGGHRYVPANRTARKAAKAARQAQAQEQEQEQVSQEQAALQLRFDLLQAENAKLAKTLKNKKKALKRIRASKSGEGSPTDTKVQVVHASGSCDEDDEDVVSKHDFLEGSEPGTSEVIDAERATHAAAQAALQQQTQASLELASNVLAPTPVAHHLPPLPSLPTPKNLLLIGTRDRTSRVYCYGDKEAEIAGRREREEARMRERGELLNDDAVNHLQYSAAAGATAGEVIATGDNLIERFIGAKAAEQIIKENADLHDERVCRLISSGYNPREACEALLATKVEGLESTARATEHLRVKSGTPMATMARAVGTVQQQMDLLAAAAIATTPAAGRAEPVFGPSLSEFVSANERAEGVSRRIQLLHDKSSFGHLSNVSKAAINLKETVRRGQDLELRNTMWLGAICLAVCEDCAKCAANRCKKEATDAADRERLLLDEKGGKRAVKDDWKESDAKHDRSLPVMDCWICLAKPES